MAKSFTEITATVRNQQDLPPVEFRHEMVRDNWTTDPSSPMQNTFLENLVLERAIRELKQYAKMAPTKGEVSKVIHILIDERRSQNLIQ